ncbi:hypothetical protein ACFX1R_020221 [Malus domestica]
MSLLRTVHAINFRGPSSLDSKQAQIQQLKKNPLVKLLKSSIKMQHPFSSPSSTATPVSASGSVQKKKPEFVGGDVARGLLLRSSQRQQLQSLPEASKPL